MIILPAIDIKGGLCVRMKKGDFATVEKVAEDWKQTAEAFQNAGANWLHMVDLDGALAGEPVNTEIFLEAAKSSGMKVEVGGGIRTKEAIETYLENGISRVILGSIAISEPYLVRWAVAKYGDRIAVGIDADNGMVKSAGWTVAHEVNYIDLAQQMEALGVQTIIFTDISRDGMLSGPNLQQLNDLQNNVSANIIASGGIRELADIQALTDAGFYGAICGKSIYQGTLDLAAAVAYTREKA